MHRVINYLVTAQISFEVKFDRYFNEAKIIIENDQVYYFANGVFWNAFKTVVLDEENVICALREKEAA